MNWSDIESKLSLLEQRISLLEYRVKNIESSLIDELRERITRMEREIQELNEDLDHRRTLVQERSE